MNALLALFLAPLLPGIINRVKAWFAGRQGPPLIQLYRDLARLLQKGAVYSQSSTVVLRLAPSVGLACCLLAVALVPLGDWPAVAAFPGQLLLVFGLLALQRFSLVLAALDTGSSFEGMGASREVQFGAFAEMGLLLCLAVVERQAVVGERTAALWLTQGPVMTLLLVALFLLFLAENCRLPVDDPNTHLELTMIHEVMVLDSSGPDLAYILYASALKMWALGSLMLAFLLPQANLAVSLAALVGLAVAVGVLESIVARLRLLRVPQMLAASSALAALAMLLLTRVR